MAHISIPFNESYGLYWMLSEGYPDSKVRGANMGPTLVLSVPNGPHVGPMDLVISPMIRNCYEGSSFQS